MGVGTTIDVSYIDIESTVFDGEINFMVSAVEESGEEHSVLEKAPV